MIWTTFNQYLDINLKNRKHLACFHMQLYKHTLRQLSVYVYAEKKTNF